MRLSGFGPLLNRVVLVLAVAQVVGWGAVGLLSIVARHVASDLSMDIAAVFAGSSVFYVTMGLLAPALGRVFARLGARRVMMAGSALSGLGFGLLAMAAGPASYFAAWAVLGAAGSATLTTAAYVMLSEVAGQRARGAISALMLITGLSSSLSWPATSFLEGAFGWRGTCLVYALLMLVICLPLYSFGLPARVPADAPAHAGATAGDAGAQFFVWRKGPFLLVALAIALNAFVTFGISAVLIELLMAENLSQSAAVAFGSALGVTQVGARAFEMVGGRRWDAIAIAVGAGALLPASLVLLMAGQGAAWAVAVFIGLYGVSSGALAVARATIPLVFFERAAFAAAMSRIALPLNLVSAASPPILAGVLARLGSSALLAIAIAFSCGGLAALVMLARRRQTERAASPIAS